MSTRAYDYIIQVADASSFVAGNVVVGTTTNTSAQILAVESNNLKVIMSNVYSEFLEGELLVSQSAIITTTNTFIDLSDSIDGETNTFSLPETFVFSDAVQVYVDGALIDKSLYSYNSNDTITFKNINTLSSSNSVLYEETVFPTIDTNRLLIQVATSNTESASFISSNSSGYVNTANSSITAITSTPYIAEKNSTQQTPLIKLYTLYYPGEWYPPNSRGNPSKSGDGYPWPYEFPIRYAEVVGETFNDFNYYVSFGGQEYKVVASESSDLRFDLSGSVPLVTLKISNFDGAIARIIEDSNIVGYNSSNSTLAFKNGELVTNIDPRTVQGNTHFNQSVVDLRGVNAVWDYSSTIANGDLWTALKDDSRDLLGGVVEIKMSYAKFLDYWPEFSTVRASTDNSVQLYSSVPYRVGDIVTSNSNSNTTSIESIKGSNVYFSNTSLASLGTSSKLLIVNPDADKNSYLKNTFTVNRLSELSEVVASFELSDWLSNFKAQLPKRKFYTTACPWKYKGKECKYPVSGEGTIPVSNPSVSANGYFTYTNESTSDASQDVCSKTLTACRLRNNLINFGGFPGVKED